MSAEMAKAYDPKIAQETWSSYWENEKLFQANPAETGSSFSVAIPPPNITGALHLGHALNATLQDILVRYHRMKGENTLWIPGTDHAGIATQAVVERRIRDEEGKSRRDLGREKLLERIWGWKDQYAKRILGQLAEIGTSCDWTRTRFTLDTGCAKAVRATFFSMFRDGLIYKGKRLVNWDTQLQTSVADDETFVETVKGGFWTFKYPIPETGEFIRFSTTRPETMLGDVAIAVHPSDERYKHLIGKMAKVPLANRLIPIIGDALLVKPEFGTGAVKVTPAHDRNDWASGQRNQLPLINILNLDGTLNEICGPFAGLDRFIAREKCVEEMDKLGYFEGKEERDIELSHSDRSKSPIEPLLSDQWFVSMGDLGEKAIEAVRDGRVKFTPERYASSYLDWLSEKRDWCISRQLWWGHRIPIWYTQATSAQLENAFKGCENIHWRESESGGLLVCALEDLPATVPGTDIPLLQDEDVLDTWFSSALWPHSTLGWPNKTEDLERYYPTNVLVTSRDIITLWVARMVLTGLYNTGRIPFHHVYIHPKILDGFGETMSKSKGNGIDPLDIISRYGADALRYQMAHLATETQDARMPVANVCPHCDTLIPVKTEHMYMRTKKITCPGCKKAFRPGGPWIAEDPDLPTAKQASERFELGRNFANKVWNAARFVMMNLDSQQPPLPPFPPSTPEDTWILSRLALTTEKATESLDAFRFSEYVRLIYDFAWSDFCDWYLEMAKPRLKDANALPRVQGILITVLDGLVRLIHPVMPFLAESLWHALDTALPNRAEITGLKLTKSVVQAPWPTYPKSWQNLGVEGSIGRIQSLIRGVREVRNRYQIDNRTPLSVVIRSGLEASAEVRELSSFLTDIAGAKVEGLGPKVDKPTCAASVMSGDMELFISLEGLIDPQVELVRTDKTIQEKQKQLTTLQSRLANADFVAKAPKELVETQKQQVLDWQAQLVSLEEVRQSLIGLARK